ncbi:uncharacterized protein EAE98_010288 [Botrytis deweyae]|uniref:2EXR domain-containing protein n=1 Tax=Botrytis deweyae TaxID=2478750 RepID=A0ABQ7I9C6_9HELO|nr:uncharacterized protein EAE98_010288 [Botrytis deweyae]KAF7917183.1 hypothetical protein EAE98_010288 [Botrytis deweyae]
MISITTTPSTFPLFSSLALELRTQIWQESLPWEFPPALYFYKKGCWQARIFTESDPGYCNEVSEQFGTEDLNRNLEFRYDLLDNFHVQTPLLFVNHEARKITLTWARSHGIEICGDPLFPRLSLPFNTVRDILYLPAAEGFDFFMEPHNRASEEGMTNLTHGVFNEVKRLAVPESGLKAYFVMASFNGFSKYYNIEALYVIINTRLGLCSIDDDLHVQSRWECESLPLCTFLLDSKRSVFELKENGYNEDDQIRLLTQEISRHLTPEFITRSPSIREIRLVLAVKG